MGSEASSKKSIFRLVRAVPAGCRSIPRSNENNFHSERARMPRREKPENRCFQRPCHHTERKAKDWKLSCDLTGGNDRPGFYSEEQGHPTPQQFRRFVMPRFFKPKILSMAFQAEILKKHRDTISIAING